MTAEPTQVGARKDLDLAEVRRRMDGKGGRELWRSLEELAATPEFEEMVHREFPQAASEWSDGVSRRRFLQVMSASLAFGGLAACTRQPLERIVPYVKQPEQIVPGKPLYFASSFQLDGFSTGVLVESHMGRPTKIEGNPEHPASLGATDLFAQASILELYDPDRAQTVKELGRIRTWTAFEEDLGKALAALDDMGGARLRFLTGTVTSPSLADLMGQVLAAYPKARWHQYQPVGRNAARVGAELAFGQPAGVHYDLTAAEVIVSLGSDFLTEGPGAVRYARDFAASRRVRSSGAGEGYEAKMNRLYCLEPSPTATGTMADHRVPASQRDIEGFARALAGAVGVGGVVGVTGQSGGDLGGPLAELVSTVVEDLNSHRGRGLVVPGESAPAAIHALCHAINSTLGNLGTTVLVTESVEAEPVDETESLSELVADMAAGEVDALFVLGGNPVYDAPADLDFVGAMQKVGRRVYLGQRENETAEYCQWVLPEAHYLESWGDGRAYDGTVSMQQPLIEPLYGGRSASEVLSILLPDGATGGEDLLKAYWNGKLAGLDFNKSWRRTLHDGVVPDSAAAPLSATPDSGAVAAALAELPATADGPELNIRPDATVWDGRFANNGWLQECPKPLTKLTWDNAALVSPALAERLGLANGQVVNLRSPVSEEPLAVPVWIHPGQAPDSVTLSLGYGRRRAGRVGTGTGFNAYELRSAASPWTVSGIEIEPTSERHQLASTQLHSNLDLDELQKVNIEGETAHDRHLVRTGTLAQFQADPEFAQHVGHGIDENLSLYEGWDYKGHAWGLSVDLSSCTGCNACVIACQAENNIPVVGKEQVAKGREMHWIRIDRYYEGDIDDPETHHQPVMCMHCEQAPCEVVCPVAATVHSDEGLNDMVYNRCVGTRYCSNNCPYKVRRFNFLKWNDTETPVLKLLRNPDVTVRSRGVMEKCTYCVQRINHVRIESRREERPIADGEIQTACQQVCPTQAIVFGDLNDKDSQVAKLKSEPLDYALLGELGTRPRTTYLAKLRNPAEGLHDPSADTADTADAADAGHGSTHE